MPSLEQHQFSSIVKLLLMGDPGTAKTSSLVSLVKADYKLRIWDFDNLLSPLVHRIRAQCPGKLSNVQFMSFRDKLISSPIGPIVDGTPKAFNDAIKALDKWEDGTVPSKWGPEYVAVIDSLTRMGDAAYRWGNFVTPAGKGGEKDGRAIYGEAQRALSQFLSLATSKSFETNLVVIAHIDYMERAGDGIMRGYPRAPGAKLAPDIPSYFENVLLAESSADGKAKLIRTLPTALVDLKNAVGGEMPQVFPADEALASFFKLAKGVK